MQRFGIVGNVRYGNLFSCLILLFVCLQLCVFGAVMSVVIVDVSFWAAMLRIESLKRVHFRSLPHN